MRTSPNTGLFSWHELLTKDTAAAKAFYGEVVGWGTQDWPDPAMAYTMWTNAKGAVGGLMSLEAAQQPEGRPRWMGTVTVDDVDATFARAVELGATVHAPVHEIPNVGRFAVLADPTGAVFCVMQPSDPAPPIDAREPGRFSWNELWTSDPEAAWAFYSALFGWVETGAMEMAPGVTYRMFGRAADQPMGGIGPKAPEGPPSSWLFYANVEDADAAGERAKALGATLLMGPMDVPGGGRVVGGVDPQGAGFAVYSQAKG
ncbi:MAG: VOC family protein [Myxococcota bacterium]